MTGLSDLSNELLTLVASHITKPSDKLHFALLNKHYHEWILPLMYRDITLDYTKYRIPQHTGLDCDKKSRLLVPQAPCSNFVRLAENLSSASQTQVRTLTLKMLANNEANVVETTLCNVLSHLPHLTQLHFALYEWGRDRQPEMFSFAPLAPALAPLSGTLRSLSIYLASRKSKFFERGDGWTVGSLRHLSCLESLSIQLGGLLGRTEDDTMATDLNALLPQCLKHFRIYWPDINPILGKVLDKWLLGEAGPSKTLQTITVQDVRRGNPSAVDFERRLEMIRKQARSLGRDVDLKYEKKRDIY